MKEQETKIGLFDTQYYLVNVRRCSDDNFCHCLYPCKSDAGSHSLVRLGDIYWLLVLNILLTPAPGLYIHMDILVGCL